MLRKMAIKYSASNIQKFTTLERQDAAVDLFEDVKDSDFNDDDEFFVNHF